MFDAVFPFHETQCCEISYHTIVQTPENVAIHKPNKGDDNREQENQEQRAETPKNDEEHECNSSENVLREIHNLEQEHAAETRKQ
ncbi:unnamed protein product [Acanthoscelides obtectus]|uniref:Uncharacterized protein n=1 Tax=Acanthoscelides obtectus TaxID=200917 RepID=A0A9P0LXV9_ACAOB|nr:unnamed protein product [Acanthoscelides obtectus]CAK1620772.1 hypothetical protein AOBTE_LOCUS558 [Acanthoscelides obtectus]